MLSSYLVGVLLSGLLARVAAHYTFPKLIVNGAASADWAYVRQTDNYQNLGPVEDVTSSAMTCYDQSIASSPATATVAAGSTIGFAVYGNPSSLYHPNVVNVYMAKAPSDVSTFTGSGQVWFKVFQIPAKTDGGSTITFPAQNLTSVNFTIPKQLPSGQYLIRAESIALHSASYYGGAQFYIGCGQISVTGGGTGTPGPLVSIPGVYTGNEPGILINIYYPIPANYTQPGPAVWPPA